MPTRTPALSTELCGDWDAPPVSRGIRVDRRNRIDERIVLFAPRRSKAGVLDQTLHLRRRCAMRRVCSRNDVFLDHERAEIVAAKPERNLPDLHPHGDPACLEVG